MYYIRSPFLQLSQRTRSKDQESVSRTSNFSNFSGPKANMQMKIQRKQARILASKPVHFVLVTSNVIELSPKVLNFSLECEQQSAFRAC